MTLQCNIRFSIYILLVYNSLIIPIFQNFSQIIWSKFVFDSKVILNLKETIMTLFLRKIVVSFHEKCPAIKGATIKKIHLHIGCTCSRNIKARANFLPYWTLVLMTSKYSITFVSQPYSSFIKQITIGELVCMYAHDWLEKWILFLHWVKVFWICFDLPTTSKIVFCHWVKTELSYFFARFNNVKKPKTPNIYLDIYPEYLCSN